MESLTEEELLDCCLNFEFYDEDKLTLDEYIGKYTFKGLKELIIKKNEICINSNF